MLFRNYNFKTISVKEMEPRLFHQNESSWVEKVLTIGIANKRREERLDLSVKAHELAIKLTSISEAVKSVWTSASTYTDQQLINNYWTRLSKMSRFIETLTNRDILR